MLWLVGLLIIGGMYLAVNAKVARAGREVLSLESRRGELQRTNAELSATYGELTAPDRMMERAVALGFRPAGPQDIEYVVVEGYAPQPAFAAPRPPATQDRGQRALSPAYTETLGQWMARWLGGGGGGER
jgi:hypothetical protein